jgi:hypothetical protein
MEAQIERLSTGEVNKCGGKRALERNSVHKGKQSYQTKLKYLIVVHERELQGNM